MDFGHQRVTGLMARGILDGFLSLRSIRSQVRNQWHQKRFEKHLVIIEPILSNLTTYLTVNPILYFSKKYKKFVDYFLQ